MKWEFDDVMDRKSFGEMLVRMGQELSEQGKITLEEGEVKLPEGFSVKIKCKSKTDKERGGESWKFGIKCKWSEGEQKRSGKKRLRSRSLKENKKTLGASWSNIMIGLKQGQLPSPEVIKEFEELNREFDSFTKRKWKTEMVQYMRVVEEFVQAVTAGDIKLSQKLTRQLTKLKTECHNSYK